jgi:plastocyanin
MVSKGSPRTHNFVVATIIVAALFAAATTTYFTTATSNIAVVAAQEQKMMRVQAGGGNATGPLTQFIPQKAEINIGQSITWYNPTTVGEPHTVTFVLDNNTMTGVVSPLAVPNSTQFMPLPPGSNNQAAMVPGKNILLALNARVYSPTVIDSQGNVKMYAPPNAKYTFNGNEKYLNSGWLLSKGNEQEFPGSGNTFTATFEKAGTYDYLCMLHPWMRGQVIVK